jgi:hypothetical protein
VREVKGKEGRQHRENAGEREGGKERGRREVERERERAIIYRL